jgi:hypothetical protein
LKASLKQAPELLNDNNPNNDASVCNKLDSFIQKVTNNVNNGQLTQEQGEILQEQAIAIMTELECF